MNMDSAVFDAIDRICIEFEDQLQQQIDVSLHEWLERVPSGFRPRLFRELLELYLDYDPSDQSMHKLRQACPEYTEILEECLQNAQPVEPLRLRPGQSVGRYLIGEQVGAGSFGEVFRGWDSQLQRDVAIKSPSLSRHCTRGMVVRFRQEAVALADLNHSHVVRVYDVVEVAGWPLLVMEYIDGHALDISLGWKLNQSVLVDVALALDYVHRNGYVHRDLKPANILIDRVSRRAVLSDFGLALYIRARIDKAGESVGTTRYMSPELVRGESHWVDGRSDIWSFGVLLYETLVGNTPFVGHSSEEIAESILHSDPIPPGQASSDCPKAIEAVCLRCLNKNPRERFASGRELAQALQGAMRSTRDGAKKRRRLVAWCVLVVLALTSTTLWHQGVSGLQYATSRTVPDVPHEPPPNVQQTEHGVQRAAGDIGRASGVACTTMITVVRDPEGAVELLRLPDAIPLRNGDEVYELSVQVSNPIFLEAFVIQSDGNAFALDVPEHLSAQREFRLPGWKVREPHAGSMTLLVCGTCRASEFLREIEKQLIDWETQKRPLARVCQFDFGNLQKLKTRGDQQLVDHYPLLINQKRFQRSPFSELDLCRSLCIPVVGR